MCDDGVTPTFGKTQLRLSVTFYFLGHTNHHKELLKVMSGRRHICVMCSTPCRADCEHCPSHLEALKVQADVIRDLKLKLLGRQELEIEHYRLKEQHLRLRQEFEKLKDVHYNQIELIYMLKKTAIENIGKRLISFLFKQT